MATKKKIRLRTPNTPDPLIQRLDEHIEKLASGAGEGSEEMKRQVKRISNDSRALREAFQSLGLELKHSDELAFHLAEVSEELKEIAGLLRIICESGTCTPDQYERLVSCVGVHWGYHLPKAKRILERVEIASRP